MPHDESGSLADLVQPGIRALAANERAKPSLSDRVSAYSFGVSQRTEQAGWWGRDVWEQVSNYKGAVALAIQPYLDYFLGAKYQAFRKRPKSVRKSVAGGFSKFSRDDDYEPLEDDHPVSVLLREPGGESGAFTLGYEMCFGYLQYLITGSAPFWLPPNADGKPCQLYALVAAHLLPATPPGADTAYPQGAYRIAPASGYGWTTTAQLTANTLLPAEQVRVMRKPHPLSRHWGMSPMQLGAKQIDLLNAIVDFQWSYFNEGVALDTVVTLPGADKATTDAVRESLLQKHGGARKARALAVFGGAAGMEGGKGATVQNLAPSPKEMDFANGREVALQEVMAFFGTPKLLAGYGDSSNYATYIGQVRMFRDMRLKPAFEGVGEFLTRHLAKPWQEDGEEIVIAAEPQIPKDEDQERQELQSALQAGAITVNEYRLATGRDPYDNGDLPLSVYVQVKQQEVAPPPQAMPGMDPTAPPGAGDAGDAGAVPAGAEGGASEEPGAIPDGDDSEQGTQEATLQAALAALGMGGTGAGAEDEPVQKAALPAKPGGAPARARQEGEVWTSAGGKRWTKKNGKVVPAPQPGGSGTGGPGASATRPAGQSAPAPAQPQPGTGAAPERQAHEMSEQESRAAGTKFFRTAGGSLYAMDAQGRTTRVKADHSAQGHDKSDVGLKERSHKTVYVPANVASALSAAGLQTGDGKQPKSRVVLHDGKATLVTWNEKENKWGATESGRNVATSDKPGKGLAPLELWKPANDVGGAEAYSGMHAGSAITEEVDHAAGHAELSKAAGAKAGTSAAPGARPAPTPPPLTPEREKFHGQILKTAGKSAKAFGLTAQVLAKMPPAAVDTIAAQLGVKPPEQHYATHAAAVPVTPRNKTHLERAHEWADGMAQKHAAKVAQHLGVRPELAQKILSKAIRQVAEHALKNGGRASGTLSVGGKNLRVGVGKPGDAARAKPAPSKPPTPQSLGLGSRDGAGARPQAGAGSPSRPRATPAAADWEQVANAPNRGTGLKRPGLLSRLANSSAGRLVGRAGSAYADLVDRGIIAFGTDEERADARSRRADRKVRKALPDESELLADLRAEGEGEIADALEQAALAVEAGDEEVFTKAMNTLSDPDGGFLVPPGNMPRRKRKKRRSVRDVVRKALEGVA